MMPREEYLTKLRIQICTWKFAEIYSFKLLRLFLFIYSFMELFFNQKIKIVELLLLIKAHVQSKSLFRE